MTPVRAVRWWRIAALVVALVLCLWVGWRDFDPWIARDDIREAIRLTIRRGVQMVVQFVAPGVLLALLARELGAWRRTSGRRACSALRMHHASHVLCRCAGRIGPAQDPNRTTRAWPHPDV